MKPFFNDFRENRKELIWTLKCSPHPLVSRLPKGISTERKTRFECFSQCFAMPQKLF